MNLGEIEVARAYVQHQNSMCSHTPIPRLHWNVNMYMWGEPDIFSHVTMT